MAQQILFYLVVGISSLLAQQESNQTNKYMGERFPGKTPIVFQKNVISLENSNEHTCSFSPDGRTLYFTRDPDRRIFVAKQKQDNTWTRPVPTELKGREAIFSPDGSRLYFGDGDIWFVEHQHGAWSQPQKLDSNINTDSYEFYASVTEGGTMYFSRFEGDHPALYVSTWEKGRYQKAVRLPPPINAENSSNFHPFISPKGDYLLFNSDRIGGFGGADLYISFKDGEGRWGTPKNLGNQINTELRDICPTVTPDGKYLFFTRNWQKDNRWYGDVYWVEASFLKR